MLKIYICDCVYFLKNMKKGGTVADMILTDPHSTYNRDFNMKWLKLAYDVLKDGGVLCSFCSPPTLDDFINQIESVGLKSKHTFSRFNYRVGRAEPCVIACKGDRDIDKINWTLKKGMDTDDKPVKGFPAEAQKPLKLIKNIIRKFSKKDNLVVDPFLGSGTTALACKQTGRKFMGCEKKMEYARVAKKRLGFHDIYQTGI